VWNLPFNRTKTPLALIEKETDVSALGGAKVDKQVRNDRLFLRAYEGESHIQNL